MTSLDTKLPADGSGDVEPEEEGSGLGARVITREAVLMLIIPPVLISAAFGGFVWWRQTAEL
ncbi:MAG: hypothetical protein L0H93_04390, partial [Nocardioides sp.]|nr:hypothetical protein [Nocardioides sp.]